MSAPVDLALSLPLQGVQWIEASAGTGKTHTLAGVFARLIVEAKLSVRQILVVTYTRAAADELRARLTARLNLCADLATNASARVAADAAEMRFGEALISAALARGEPRAEIARRLRLAAVSLDEAQISTVHAFCQRALREHAWTAGVAPVEGDLIDNERARYDAIARDVWRECAMRGDAVAWNALRKITPTHDVFADRLWDLRDARCVLEPASELDQGVLRERIEAFAQEWNALRQRWNAESAHAFAALSAHSAADHLNQAVYRIEKIAREHASLHDAFAGDADLDVGVLARYTPNAIASKIKKGRQPFAAPALFAAFESMLDVQAQTQQAERQLGLHLLRECADEARRRSERDKRARREFSYDDLVTQLHRVVAGGAAANLAQQFSAALVDECQDSDARQFELFFAIYRGRGLLCLIGDPKQAIYRFRGGDVNAYLRAREQADGRHTLKTNYRSIPALVAALDLVYANAAAGAFGESEIRFENVTAAGAARDDDLLVDDSAHAPLRFWQVDGDGPNLGNKGDAAEHLAAGCAQEICSLLAKARQGRAALRRVDPRDGVRRHLPLRAQDMAVLVNTHGEAATVQRALARRGVPCVVISRESVFASADATDLLAILRALAEFDEARLRGVLATRLLGFDAAEIADLNSDAARWRDQVGLFTTWRQLWREHGVLALLEQLAERRAGAVLAQPDGERRLTNLLHLADLLQQAAARLDGERALIDWLAKRIMQADKDNEAEQLRLESDGDRVHISTLHVSKGLQYPLVFLPFAPMRRELPRSRFSKFTRGAQKVLFVRADKNESDHAKEAEYAEESGERLRLLYVGLTRAQVACHVACGVVGSRGDPSALAQLLGAGNDAAVAARIAEYARREPQLIALTDLPSAQSDRLPVQETTAYGPARTATRKVRLLRAAYSYSQLSANGRSERPGEDETAVPDTVTLAPIESTSTLRGPRFGIAFHEIVEKSDFAAWRDDAAETGAPRELVENVLRRHGFPGDAAAREMSRLVRATLRLTLPAGLRLCDLAPQDSRREMPFHFAIAGADAARWLALLHAHGYVLAREKFVLDDERLRGLMSGFLDLVFVHGGRWWIVDYKTNHLGAEAEAYSDARLHTAVRAAEYDLQYLIYLVALHRWLKRRVPDYDYERDIGGALYLFVRGMQHGRGVFVDRPPATLIEACDALLAASQEAAA